MNTDLHEYWAKLARAPNPNRLIGEASCKVGAFVRQVMIMLGNFAKPLNYNASLKKT